MPTVIKSQLNAVVHADLSAAEVNAGAAYAAVTLRSQGDQANIISGVIAQTSIFFPDVSAQSLFEVFCRRNLSPGSQQAWQSLRNANEEILFYQVALTGQNALLSEKFPIPVELEPNVDYAFIIGFIPGAAFVNGAVLRINVLGNLASSSGRSFPYVTR